MFSSLSAKLAFIFFLTTLVGFGYSLKLQTDIKEMQSFIIEQDKAVSICLGNKGKAKNTMDFDIPKQQSSAIDILNQAQGKDNE